jgi:hypothetical protein
MVAADGLILKWDAALTFFNDLWEIKMQAIQSITWNTNAGRSLLGTKMPGWTAAFKHAIQPDGSLLAELDGVVQDKMDGKPPVQAELKHQMGKQMFWWCFLDKMTPNVENQGKHAKWHNKAEGDVKPPIQAELKPSNGHANGLVVLLGQDDPQHC